MLNPKSNYQFSSGSQWLGWTLGLFLLISAVVVSLNIWFNVYGLFGNPGQITRVVLGDERVAKHLLAMNYVPGKFDTVLLGSSVSGNLQIAQAGSNTFNLSINGGNVVESKALLDEYLAIRKPKRVILLVHPYFTSAHDFQTARLKPRDWWSALGSLSLINAYKEQLNTQYLGHPPKFKADGSYIFGNESKPLNSVLRKMFFEGKDFDVDPIAAKVFERMVKELNSLGVPVTYLILPMQGSILAPKKAAFEAYGNQFVQWRKPGDSIFDMTQGPVQPDAVAGRYSDGIHLTDKWASEISRLIANNVGVVQ